MATRSSIAYKTERGVTAIYCHWDGYPAGVGDTLEEHYQAAYKIGKLVMLGNLSSLGEEIGKQHDFDARYNGGEVHEDWCMYYGRDRGETGQEPKEFADIKDWVEHYTDAWCEYFYLWNGKEWLVHARGDTDSMGFPIFNINKDVVERELVRLRAQGYDV